MSRWQYRDYALRHNNRRISQKRTTSAGREGKGCDLPGKEMSQVAKGMKGEEGARGVQSTAGRPGCSTWRAFLKT